MGGKKMLFSISSLFFPGFKHFKQGPYDDFFIAQHLCGVYEFSVSAHYKGPLLSTAKPPLVATAVPTATGDWNSPLHSTSLSHS